MRGGVWGKTHTHTLSLPSLSLSLSLARSLSHVWAGHLKAHHSVDVDGHQKR